MGEVRWTPAAQPSQELKEFSIGGHKNNLQPPPESGGEPHSVKPETKGGETDPKSRASNASLNAMPRTLSAAPAPLAPGFSGKLQLTGKSKTLSNSSTNAGVQEKRTGGLFSRIIGGFREKKATIEQEKPKSIKSERLPRDEEKRVTNFKNDIKSKGASLAAVGLVHYSRGKTPIDVRKNILNTLKNFYNDPSVELKDKVAVAQEMKTWIGEKTGTDPDSIQLNAMRTQIHDLGNKVINDAKTPEGPEQPVTKEQEQPIQGEFGRSWPMFGRTTVKTADIEKSQGAARLAQPEIDRKRHEAAIPNSANNVFENMYSLVDLEQSLTSLQAHLADSGSKNPAYDAANALRKAAGDDPGKIQKLKEQLEEYGLHDEERDYIQGFREYNEMLYLRKFSTDIYKQL